MKIPSLFAIVAALSLTFLTPAVSHAQVQKGYIEATATGTGGTSTATANQVTGQITTASLTTAAGASHVCTVSCDRVSSGTKAVVHAVVTGYAGAGIPVVTQVTEGTGTFAVTLTNLHASAAVNAPIKFQFSVARP
jgi:hypothetical protein